MNTLTIKRYNGDEIYKINKATLNFYEKTPQKFLKIHVTTDAALETLDDSKNLKALPNAEISLNISGFDKNLLENASFPLEASLDTDINENLATLYYVEHQDLDQNEVKISSNNNGTYTIQWVASTRDVCFYDGSKPENKVIIETECIFLDK